MSTVAVLASYPASLSVFAAAAHVAQEHALAHAHSAGVETKGPALIVTIAPMQMAMVFGMLDMGP